MKQCIVLILLLGILVGCQDKAQAIIGKVRKEVATTQKRVSANRKKKVFFQIGVKPLFTATRNTLVNDYIELSNNMNIAEHEGSGVYSREKVINADPDFIFVTTMGSAGGSNFKAKEKAAWLKYSSLRATRNNHIYVLDSNKVCSPTPLEFVEMLKHVVEVIHSDNDSSLMK